MARVNKKARGLLSLRTHSKIFVLVAVALVFQTVFLSSKLYIASSADDSGTTFAPHGVVPASDRASTSTSSDPRVAIGEILPDGTVTFTPEEFRAGRHDNYVNLPNVPVDPDRDDEVRRLLADETVPPPAEVLLHAAPTPPGSNAILGLASYPKFMDGWRKMVGSLRMNGYDGHIIVGVNPAIPREERDYLDLMGVTYYAVEVTDCDASILDDMGVAHKTDTTDNAVRARCSRGLGDLKLEWGRFEMARRWLNACESCAGGWSMVVDTRDIFFQSDPFAALGDPKLAEHDLMFVEEIAGHTNTLLLPKSPHRATNLGHSMRYKVHVHPCYGKEVVAAHELLDRPMLCSGTVIGTSDDGMYRFLSVLVDEFRRNNGRGPSCRSPRTTDQWTMNHLYYKGRFGFRRRTKTLPWGTGPVLTVGKPCVDSALKTNGDSQRDMMEFGEDGLVLNPHEGEGSAYRVAPTLHQWDRCRRWIRPWFEEHEELFMRADRPEDEPAMKWVKG